MNLIFKIIKYFKYRSIKFKSIGKSCNFKSLRSSFLKSCNIILGNNVWIGPNADFNGGRLL